MGVDMLRGEGVVGIEIGAEPAFIGPQSAINFAAAASPCVTAVLRLTLPPHNRSWSCVTKGGLT
jgi:hypothetical protein